jgi:hypothetical protein
MGLPWGVTGVALVKSLGQAAFFRVFDRAVMPADSVDVVSAWTVEGVDWTRRRFSQRGAGAGFAIEIVEGVKPGRNGWSMMVVRETWWDGRKADPLKDRQWVNLTAGRRNDALAWFQTLEGRSPVS